MPWLLWSFSKGNRRRERRCLADRSVWEEAHFKPDEYHDIKTGNSVPLWLFEDCHVDHRPHFLHPQLRHFSAESRKLYWICVHSNTAFANLWKFGFFSSVAWLRYTTACKENPEYPSGVLIRRPHFAVAISLMRSESGFEAANLVAYRTLCTFSPEAALSVSGQDGFSQFYLYSKMKPTMLLSQIPSSRPVSHPVFAHCTALRTALASQDYQHGTGVSFGKLLEDLETVRDRPGRGTVGNKQRHFLPRFRYRSPPQPSSVWCEEVQNDDAAFKLINYSTSSKSPTAPHDITLSHNTQQEEAKRECGPANTEVQG